MEYITDYAAMNAQLKSLTEDIPYETANLANAAALLWEHLPGINWAGFYKMTDGKLVLGPFQGKTACIVIPVGKEALCLHIAQQHFTLVHLPSSPRNGITRLRNAVP